MRKRAENYAKRVEELNCWMDRETRKIKKDEK